MSLRGAAQRRRSNLPRLYCITGRRFPARLAPLVQLREKSLPTAKLLPLARRLQKICKKRGAKLLINSRVDVALALNLDGVHFPAVAVIARSRAAAAKQSPSISKARLLLGPRKLIGVSAHSLREALAAQRGGADFITFGPVFETPSKKKYGKPPGLKKLETVCRKLKIPIYALGGLSLDQLPLVRRHGAHGLAAIRAFRR